MSNFVRIASDDTAGCVGVVVLRTEFNCGFSTRQWSHTKKAKKEQYLTLPMEANAKNTYNWYPSHYGNHCNVQPHFPSFVHSVYGRELTSRLCRKVLRTSCICIGAFGPPSSSSHFLFCILQTKHQLAACPALRIIIGF